MIVVVLGAFFAGRGCATSNAPALPEPPTIADSTGGGWNPDASLLTDILKGGVLTVPIEDDATAMPDAAPTQATTSVQVSEGARTATLRPLEGRQGSGVATSAFTAGRFQHVVVASLPMPPEGSNYHVWLVRSSPFDFFQAGRLIQRADDARWYALFTAANDRRDYTKVVVTLEQGGENAAPGDAVLEGVLERTP
jgi:hypothetical protein